MIFTFLISIVSGILAFIVDLLPSVDSVTITNIENQITPFRNLLIANNWWFPIDQLLYVIEVFIILTVALITWLIIRFIAHLFTMGAVK